MNNRHMSHDMLAIVDVYQFEEAGGQSRRAFYRI